METRADRIESILKDAPKRRLETAKVTELLLRLEKRRELNASIVPATIAQDNKTRVGQGRSPRFRTWGDGGEEWGWVSLPAEEPAKAGAAAVNGPTQPPTQASAGTGAEKPSQPPAEAIKAFCDRVNAKVRQRVRDELETLHWREFEEFLPNVLQALGFQDATVTQPTRDGGVDVRCDYRRGVVSAQAIVSAKQWVERNVGPAPIRELRGITDNADTGIIVTCSSFTDAAKAEAKPANNARVVYLIDGDQLVDACMEAGIGVTTQVVLPGPDGSTKLHTFVGLPREKA